MKRVPGSLGANQDSGPAVVALGGGHGLASTLKALRRLTDQITAVVGVADDGGSSGRLRKEFG
ncbi:MAG: 2-phospho-L-lactate transferase CofD family protein, partial [Actinomycetota bacterium]|nr:2-phospho-L-lactate transferase CofD family protein [Actinomycetota bacterium]